MELFVVPAKRLRLSERKFIADHLTRAGSDFQQALLSDGEPAGTIAVCLDQGEIIGWARTEIWQGLPTLEAFVGQEYRERGVATLCAAGLVASNCFRYAPFVAVFRVPMAILATRLGIQHISYRREPDGSWIQV
jgi:hypothetical protein